MKKIIFIFTLCFVFCSTSVFAARFGSGKSFGQNRSSHSSSHSNNSQGANAPGKNQEQRHASSQQSQNAQIPQKRSWTSKILPALAGLSIGALLGSLLSGHGLGGGFASILIALAVGGIILYAIKKLFSTKQENKGFSHFQNAAAQTDGGHTVPIQSYPEYPEQPQTPSSNLYQIPSFDKEQFLRTAKVTFVRMQNAFDSRNLNDIRNFTTPEVFGEIQMQIQERGDVLNHTDVIYVKATLIDEPEMDNNFVGILFSGQIREQQNGPAIDINEIWHFVKNEKDQWLIAGIEQKNDDRHQKF